MEQSYDLFFDGQFRQCIVTCGGFEPQLSTYRSVESHESYLLAMSVPLSAKFHSRDGGFSRDNVEMYLLANTTLPKLHFHGCDVCKSTVLPYLV